MRWPQGAKRILQVACRRNSMRLQVRRWKAWFADSNCQLLGSTPNSIRREKGDQVGRPSVTEVWKACNISKHLHAHHVNAVAGDVTAHGYMMTLVAFQSVRILDRKYLLVAVSQHYHLRPRGQALLRAGFRASIGALGTALVVADPAIHGGPFVIPC